MGFSAKLFEIIVYPESYDMSKLHEVFENNAIKDWAYIVHDKDGNKSHAHVTIKTIDSRQSDYVAKWFGVNEASVSRCKGRWADMLKYLTHANAPEKFQYSPSEVFSNFDWQAVINKSSSEDRLNEIIEGIASGVIRQYNYYDHISDKEYIKYNRQITMAFNYRLDKIKGFKRDMECIFITGDSGFGKTTYAKLICDERNLSYYVSSGSNDVLDGYNGEDVLILDDLRPSVLRLADLLKMLDNHTASTVSSRYRNKVLECKMIIITTVLPIDTFFNNVFAEEKETIVQLKRRCKTYIRMFEDYMNIYLYDDFLRDYDEPFSARNPIALKYKSDKLSKQAQAERLKSILGNIELDSDMYVDENSQLGFF